jgi:hypothetical protein
MALTAPAVIDAKPKDKTGKFWDGGEIICR